MSNAKFVVQVVRDEDQKVVKEIECSSERQAEKIERGVQINLDHANYFTLIMPSSHSKVSSDGA